MSFRQIYGEKNINTPINEVAQCDPSSDYAVSKLDAEKRLAELFNSGIVNRLDILRLAPVYDSEWSLNIERRIFAPKKIAYIKFGTGMQKMSAVSRKNLIGFIKHLIIIDQKIGDKYFNIYNVCDESSYSFNKLIKTFRKVKKNPNRPIITIPLIIVWVVTRMAGLIIPKKKKWLHSCYDKLSIDLEFNNDKMLKTGFRPNENIETVILKK